MQPSTETRLAKHSRHKARLLHKAASVLKVAAEVESRSKRGGNNFGIRKLASRIILMTDSFKQIVRDTVVSTALHPTLLATPCTVSGALQAVEFLTSD